MSKTTFTMFVTFLVLVLVGVTTTYIIYKYVDTNNSISNNNSDYEEEEVISNNNSDVNSEVEDVGLTRTVNEFQFKDEFGSGQKLVTIKAVECERLTGFPGATSNVYCVTGNKELIHLELANLTQKIIATNIDRIEVNGNGVLAYYNTNYNSKIEDSYVTYVESN